MSDIQEQQPGFRSTLKNRYFLRLWLAQLISQTIQNATNYASIVLVSKQTGSTTVVGGVLIAFSLPVVLFGIPAGVLVDRVNKGVVLWASNIIRGIISFGFIISLIIAPNAYVPIYLLTFVISIVGQFFGPAEGSAIPLLVKKNEIVSALSLFNVTFTLSQAIGYIALAPIILQLPAIFPIAMAQQVQLFLVVGILYLICAILTASIPPQLLKAATLPAGAETGRQIRSVWKGFLEAGQFALHDPRLAIALVQLSLGGVIISVVGTIAPTFSRQFMNLPIESAGLLIFLPAGIGLVGGSAIMPRIIHRIGLARAELVGIVGLSGSIFMITISHWLIVSAYPTTWSTQIGYIVMVILMLTLLGVCLALINLPAQTMMQERSTDWIRGRILALQLMMQNAAILPVVPLVGLMADTQGLPFSMNILAIAIIIFGFASVFYAERGGLHSRPLFAGSLPAIRQKQRPTPGEPMALRDSPAQSDGKKSIATDPALRAPSAHE